MDPLWEDRVRGGPQGGLRQQLHHVLGSKLDILQQALAVRGMQGGEAQGHILPRLPALPAGSGPYLLRVLIVECRGLRRLRGRYVLIRVRYCVW